MSSRYILLSICFILVQGIGFGQKIDSSITAGTVLAVAAYETNSPDLEAQLVPLDDIINVAIKYSPYLKYDSVMMEVHEADIVLAKRRWHNNLNGFANYSGGNQYYLFTGTPSDAQNNMFNGFRYGVNLSLPLGDITTRRLRIDQERAKYRAYSHKKDQTELELRKQVIADYNNLISAQRILKIKTVARENALVLQQMANKSFHEGTTSLQDYATVSDITNDAEADYELAKSSFSIQYRQFEDLLGVQLTSLMKKK